MANSRLVPFFDDEEGQMPNRKCWIGPNILVVHVDGDSFFLKLLNLSEDPFASFLVSAQSRNHALQPLFGHGAGVDGVDDLRRLLSSISPW